MEKKRKLFSYKIVTPYQHDNVVRQSTNNNRPGGFQCWTHLLTF